VMTLGCPLSPVTPYSLLVHLHHLAGGIAEQV
jgi:hypothetical protein